RAIAATRAVPLAAAGHRPAARAPVAGGPPAPAPLSRRRRPPPPVRADRTARARGGRCRRRRARGPRAAHSRTAATAGAAGRSGTRAGRRRAPPESSDCVRLPAPLRRCADLRAQVVAGWMYIVQVDGREGISPYPQFVWISL